MNDNFDTIYNEFNGNIAAANLATGAVTTAKISDSNVTTAKIADSNVTTAKIQDGAITAPKLSTSAITLGYTQITSNFTTTSTTPVQVTSLSSSVTIPSGSRRILITVFTSAIFHSTSGADVELGIWDGTVGSGTLLSESLVRMAAVNQQISTTCMASAVPSAGAKTYNVSLHSATGATSTLSANATAPAFILVQAI